MSKPVTRHSDHWFQEFVPSGVQLVLMIAVAAPAVAGAPPEQPLVDQLMDDLQSDSFIRRDFAARRLGQYGESIVPRLKVVVRGGDDDARIAVVSLLERWSLQDDAAGEQAHRALQGLSESDSVLTPEVARRVHAALRRAERRVVGIVTALGGSVERNQDLGITAVKVNNELFGDRQARLLARLGRLERLDLRKTGITNHALGSLASLRELQTLNLSETIVTSVGLQELAPLTRLRQLSLYHTEISPDGLRWCEEHLPDCEIRQ